MRELPREHCPLEYACLRNHKRCINVLCKHDYRVELYEEDNNIIEAVLKEPDSARNDYHFYRKFLVGDRHVAQFYQLKSFLSFFFKLITSRQRKKDNTDPVERFIRFKAFANPHYIASHFVEKCKKESNLAGDDLGICDPIRKSLCLARYSKLLSFHFVQYSQEYLEISKVRQKDINKLCSCSSALLCSARARAVMVFALYTHHQPLPTTITLLSCFSAPCGQIRACEDTF